MTNTKCNVNKFFICQCRWLLMAQNYEAIFFEINSCALQICAAFKRGNQERKRFLRDEMIVALSYS